MATRTLKATLGSQPPVPPSDDLKKSPEEAAPTTPTEPTTPPATAPDAAPTAPAEETVAPPEPSEAKDTNTAPALKEEEPAAKPSILVMAEKELSEMIGKLQSNLDSLKAQKAETPDQMELIKLSCAKVLREATYKLGELEETVAEMRTMSRDVEQKHKGLEQAKQVLNERSSTFRNERDAFIKMRGMSEKEFYELAAKIQEEK